MKYKEIVFIGGGGFAHEVLEVAIQLDYFVKGYFDDKKTNIKLDYLGTLEEYFINSSKYDLVFLAIGAVSSKSNELRQSIISHLDSKNVKIPSLISPHAVISKDSLIGNGVFIAHNVVLSTNTSIDDFCIINTTSVIGHHSTIARNVIISPLVFIGGGVTIGRNVIIGSSATIMQGLVVGDFCTIGMGTNVFTNLDNRTTVWPFLNKTSEN